VGASLTLAQEVKHLVSLHAEPSLQDVLQVLVERLHLVDVRVLELHCKLILHCSHSLVKHFLDLVLVSLCRALGHVLEKLVLATGCKSFKLAFQVLRMQGHFLVPITAFNDKRLRLLLITLHVLLHERVEDCSKLVSDLFERLLLQLLDLIDNLVVRVLPDELELRVEAVVQLRHQIFGHLLEHLVEHVLIVLLGHIFIELSSFAHDSRASLTKLLDDIVVALCI